MDKGPQDHFEGSHYLAHRATGPFSFLHPTKRYLSLSRSDAKPDAAGPTTDSTEDSAPARRHHHHRHHHHIYHVWRSRDNRKGRHAVAFSPDYAEKAGDAAPRPTNTLQGALKGMLKMVTRYPVWDVSYDVATIFTLGSAVWVINGFFEWLPLQAPGTEFNGESSVGGGITALVGATIFEIGSVLLMLEAVNENRSDCFGWALEEAWESGMLTLVPTHDKCKHHHRNKSAWLKHAQLRRPAIPPSENGVDSSSPPSPSAAQADAGGENQKPTRMWSWWPSWYELKTHYFRDVGFLACFSQMIGATVFWISGFTGLPPILNNLSVPASNGIFWLPQVIGGSGFIISSTLFMLEVQEKWYIPAPKMLGWHIGLWNLIGAIGFTLCGALGFAINAPNMAYASTLSTFIGSWAFLIGSVIQWYESLDKYPVTVESDLSRISSSSSA